jgi:hypothetical protein
MNKNAKKSTKKKVVRYLFSKRMKLEKDYYEWLEEKNKKQGQYFKIKDCPMTVISYLSIIGLLKGSRKLSPETKISFIYETMDDL